MYCVLSKPAGTTENKEKGTKRQNVLHRKKQKMSKNLFLNGKTLFHRRSLIRARQIKFPIRKRIDSLFFFWLSTSRHRWQRIARLSFLWGFRKSGKMWPSQVGFVGRINLGAQRKSWGGVMQRSWVLILPDPFPLFSIFWLRNPSNLALVMVQHIFLEKLMLT